jgi:hypothetical protein
VEQLLNYFDSLEILEPKCPKCGIILDYGVNTVFKDEVMAHVCSMCGYVLK